MKALFLSLCLAVLPGAFAQVPLPSPTPQSVISPTAAYDVVSPVYKASASDAAGVVFPKVQYKVLLVSSDKLVKEFAVLEEQLNKWGENGWSLKTHTPLNNTGLSLIILERTLPSE